MALMLIILSFLQITTLKGQHSDHNLKRKFKYLHLLILTTTAKKTVFHQPLTNLLLFMRLS